MRFIDGDEVWIPFLDIFHEPGEHQSLWSDIEQAILAGVQAIKTTARFRRVER